MVMSSGRNAQFDANISDSSYFHTDLHSFPTRRSSDLVAANYLYSPHVILVLHNNLLVSQPPTILTVRVLSPLQVDLSWTAPTNNEGSAITGYMIERSADSGTSWSNILSNTGSTATTYS